MLVNVLLFTAMLPPLHWNIAPGKLKVVGPARASVPPASETTPRPDAV